MRHLFTTTAIFLATTFPSFADEVSDTITSALQAYEEGDIQYALEELAFATQLLNEMKSASLSAFLPEAPDGWTRAENDRFSAGMAIVGGGIGAGADYNNGSVSVSITIMADNPMVGAFAGMLGNTALLGASGAKMIRVGRMKFMDQQGQLTGLINGRILIQAEGAETDQMLPILALIDFKELAKFGQ